MENMTTGLVVAVVIVLVSLGVLGWLYLRSRRINLTQAQSATEKPQWMGTTPPPETVAATQSGQGHVGLYGQEKGEHIAAPFAEQIEDILHARLQSNASLAALKVDLGTAPNGDLEIWVDGTCYNDIDAVPNPQLREVFKEAVKHWEETQAH